MAKQYKALKPVGRFQEGDIVGGLADAQIKELLAKGVIEEVKTTAVTAKKASAGDTK